MCLELLTEIPSRLIKRFILVALSHEAGVAKLVLGISECRRINQTLCID